MPQQNKDKTGRMLVIPTVSFPYDLMYAENVGVDVVANELETYSVKLESEEIKYLQEDTLGHTLQLRGNQTLIYFKDKPDEGLIAHEVFHAVWMILGRMGVEPSEDSNEVYAYLIEYFVREIMKNYEK